jgi:protein gp37
MGEKSSIEWTDASWTPIRAIDLKTGKIGWYCEHSTTGCINCYSESMNKRLGTGLPFKPGHRDHVNIFLDEKMLFAPLRWKKPRMIFVCSMTDLFADFVPDEWIVKFFAVMALCPQHTFQVLTKRAERMRQWFSDIERSDQVGLAMLTIVDHIPHGHRRVPWPLPNVWLGVSTERQQEADERIPHLLQTPAAVRFISAEPLLDHIALHALNLATDHPSDALRGMRAEPDTDPFSPKSYRNVPTAKLDLVIVGGESGPNARACWTSDVRDIVKWCTATGVAVFVKQMGGNVQDRNDAGFEGCGPTEWPLADQGQIDFEPNGYVDEAQGSPCRIRLKDRKGGDINEWPEDLRVREMPKVTA